jgi:stage V sporulation protein R
MEDPELIALSDAMEPIWDIAHNMGLDPFPVHFEMVPPSIMYEFGSYGLPGRFSHWSHGKVYHRMKTSYDYGLSKIYELVINTNPSYAFLMEGNSVLQNKLVIAHVLGHCDFFKNNAYFQATNRHMVETASLNANRVRQYEFEHGLSKVERFLDAALSIQEHIDPADARRPQRRKQGDRPDEKQPEPQSAPGSPFDDLFSLTPDKPRRSEAEASREERRHPAEPQKDVVGYIMQHSRHLEQWQRDIIGIVREEMLYFVPQMQTKVANEGWASLWHSRIMRELDLTDEEYTDFATMHSGVISPSRHSINPYFLGIKLLEDIERRWDNPTEEEQIKWGRKPGEGHKKLLEVREQENDVSLIRNYLTEQLVEDLDMYLYERQGDQWVIVDKNWENVRDGIVARMANFGNPTILVEDGDYHHNGELYLRHTYDGNELDAAYAEKTLEHIYSLWGRPVYLETIAEEQGTVFSYNGSVHERETM